MFHIFYLPEFQVSSYKSQIIGTLLSFREFHEFQGTRLFLDSHRVELFGFLSSRQLCFGILSSNLASLEHRLSAVYNLLKKMKKSCVGFFITINNVAKIHFLMYYV